MALVLRNQVAGHYQMAKWERDTVRFIVKEVLEIALADLPSFVKPLIHPAGPPFPFQKCTADNS